VFYQPSDQTVVSWFHEPGRHWQATVVVVEGTYYKQPPCTGQPSVFGFHRSSTTATSVPARRASCVRAWVERIVCCHPLPLPYVRHRESPWLVFTGQDGRPKGSWCTLRRYRATGAESFVVVSQAPVEVVIRHKNTGTPLFETSFVPTRRHENDYRFLLPARAASSVPVTAMGRPPVCVCLSNPGVDVLRDRDADLLAFAFQARPSLPLDCKFG